MLLKLFGKNKNSEFDDADLPRVCRFCERATLISDEENVLCSVRGIVLADYCCRKFSYDPLKREPKMPPPIPKPDPTRLDIGLPPFLMADSPADGAADSADTAPAGSGDIENNNTTRDASETTGAATPDVVPCSEESKPVEDKPGLGDDKLPEDKPVTKDTVTASAEHSPQ